MLLKCCFTNACGDQWHCVGVVSAAAAQVGHVRPYMLASKSDRRHTEQLMQPAARIYMCSVALTVDVMCIS